MIGISNLFQALPIGLRDPLLGAYAEIVRNYTEGRWEPAELNGGKLCEIVYTIIKGTLDGNYASSPSKPAQFVSACRALEQCPANSSLIGDRSLRILMPRFLPFLYEIRNNRGVGHVGGDVSPNVIDASIILNSANWIMAELVRIYHNVPLVEAEAAVSALVERRLPLVWEIGGVKRVLDTNFSTHNKVLALLYSTLGWVDERVLRGWVEYRNSTNFKTLILNRLHVSKKIEYDRVARRVHLTPLGVAHVESELLK